MRLQTMPLFTSLNHQRNLTIDHVQVVSAFANRCDHAYRFPSDSHEEALTLVSPQHSPTPPTTHHMVGRWCCGCAWAENVLEPERVLEPKQLTTTQLSPNSYGICIQHTRINNRAQHNDCNILKTHASPTICKPRVDPQCRPNGYKLCG